MKIRLKPKFLELSFFSQSQVEISKDKMSPIGWWITKRLNYLTFHHKVTKLQVKGQSYKLDCFIKNGYYIQLLNWSNLTSPWSTIFRLRVPPNNIFAFLSFFVTRGQKFLTFRYFIFYFLFIILFLDVSCPAPFQCVGGFLGI